MRDAEREYVKNPTPFNERVVYELQDKVDGWLCWISQQQNEELKKKVPPFFGILHTIIQQNDLSVDFLKKLAETHTQEEIEQFLTDNFNGRMY